MFLLFKINKSFSIINFSEDNTPSPSMSPPPTSTMPPPPPPPPTSVQHSPASKSPTSVQYSPAPSTSSSLSSAPSIFIPSQTINNISREIISGAFNLLTFIIRFTALLITMYPDDFLELVGPLVEDLLEYFYNANLSVKIGVLLRVQFVQRNRFGEVTRRNIQNFHIDAASLDHFNFHGISIDLNRLIMEFVNCGSNWEVDRVEYMEFDITRFNSIRHAAGRSNRNGIQLPKSLLVKMAVVNVHNDNADCFKYALLSVLHYDDVLHNRHRASNYTPWLTEQNWEGITMPMTAAQLPKFERNNPGIVINLLEWRGDKDPKNPVHRIRVAPIPKTSDVPTRCVSIMAVQIDGDKWHYVGVTNINRLLNSGANKYDHNRKYCERCFKPLFPSKNIPNPLESHLKVCYADRPDSVKMPEEKEFSFVGFAKTQPLPYVFYADIECFLQVDPNNPKITRHVPYAFGLLLVPYPNMKHKPLDSKYKVFVGSDCILDGCKYIHEVSKQVYAWNLKYSDVQIKMSLSDNIKFKNALKCFMCDTPFTREGVKKVRDHDHLTGNYRGAACQDCNTKMRLKRNVLPVFFHNLRGYDGHLLCEVALGMMKEWELTVIPQTAEKYISMQAKYKVGSYKSKKSDKENAVFMNIQFKDSVQFLPDSLDRLVRNLESVKITKRAIPPNAPDHISKSKGIFPYEWFDSPAKANHTQLPPREAFYDSLNIKECSSEDYNSAHEAWNVFSCQTFGDYILAYLKLDVHQLADVFEAFRALALREDGLDPSHYYTLPGLTLDSAFKMTRTRVDLIQEQDQYEFIEKGIRGGCTFVNTHYLHVNAPEIDPFSYNPNLPRHEMLYLDMNNLYGHALSAKLPYSEFTWLSEQEISLLSQPNYLLNMDVDGDFGYLLEVDLIYPQEIHDKTKDFPFAPEKLKIGEEHLSDLMKRQISDLGMSTKTYEKLLLTQWDKPGYVVHFKLLQFYLRHGMQVQKIVQGIKFRQGAIFEKYISYNSSKRSSTNIAFERDFYKLKNNALYGKTVENVRRRMNFRLVNNEESLLKFSSNPSFTQSIIFSNELVGVKLRKDQVTLNKPVFVGQAVLDLAKLEMYELFYEQLKGYESKFIDSKISIVGGDTDSFFISVTNCDVYNQLLPAMQRDGLLDSSNYATHHPLFSNQWKAKLGCVKDESEGYSYKEWVLLRPKAYSMLCINDSGSKKRAKGVRRATVREMRHSEYVDAYQNQVVLYKNQRRIASNKHHVSTIEYNKISLSFYEDKRYWLDINESLPFGHFSLNSIRPVKLLKGTIPTHVVLDTDDEPPRKRPRVMEEDDNGGVE